MFLIQTPHIRLQITLALDLSSVYLHFARCRILKTAVNIFMNIETLWAQGKCSLGVQVEKEQPHKLACCLGSFTYAIVFLSGEMLCVEQCYIISSDVRECFLMSVCNFFPNLSTCVKLQYFNIRFKIASGIYIYFSASLIYKVCQINMPYLSINYAGCLIKGL